MKGALLAWSTAVLRWVGIHDGFGLFIGLIPKPFVETEDAIARFKERISALAWARARRRCREIGRS